MDIDRLTPRQKKIMIDTYEAKLLTESDCFGVLSLVKGERKDGFIVDVRDAKSFGEGHIPGAVNIPYEEIEKKFRAIPKDKTVILYCWGADSTLSTKAAHKLCQLDIYCKVLRSGWTEWVAAKRPVQRT